MMNTFYRKQYALRVILAPLHCLMSPQQNVNMAPVWAHLVREELVDMPLLKMFFSQGIPFHTAMSVICL